MNDDSQSAFVDSAIDVDDDDIVLAELSDDALVEQMFDDLYDGLREPIEEGTNLLLARGWSAERVLNEALVAGMKIVGIDFPRCCWLQMR
jgi:5-methyltetrahydrofolate--homocysteine methyltransferase